MLPETIYYCAQTRVASDTDKILYITYNAGEIVFDSLLIETLLSLCKKVKAVVKGSPVINDSTVEDAIESGLTGLCEVVDNGSDAVGTILQWSPLHFRRHSKMLNW